MNRYVATTPLGKKACCSFILIVLSILLSSTCRAATAAGRTRSAAAVVHLDLDLNQDSYDGFYDRLYDVLAAGRPVTLLKGHGVCAPVRRARPPARWINVRVIGDGDEATMVFRDDDIACAAFRNKAGELFTMAGTETDHPSLFPRGGGGTVLPFRADSYTELLGCGGYRRIPDDLPLGRKAGLFAAHILSNYQHGVTQDVAAQRAVAVLVVMIAESIRFNNIREIINSDLNFESHLTEQQALYTQHWANLSLAIYQWNKTGRWGDDEYAKKVEGDLGISNGEIALEMANILFRP